MENGNGQLATAINSSETLGAFASNYVNTGGGGSTVVGSVTSNCLPGTSWTYSWPYYVYNTESKTEKAYQVIRALMKAKIVKLNSLPKFFELMDELMKVL